MDIKIDHSDVPIRLFKSDFLEFFIDGALVKSISGTTDWISESYRISKTGTGSHTLLWKYRKDGSGSAGEDRGWVDNVQWTSISPTLAEALDNKDLIWIADGDNGWYGQTANFYFGDSAARSDIIDSAAASVGAAANTAIRTWAEGSY